MATTSSDATLVTLAAGGDERAFELLFQRHRTDVQAYAVRMLRDHGRAEDVVQDVFVSAMRAIRGASPADQPVHVRAWLREIARKACIDQWRGTTRRGEVSLDDPEHLLAGDALRLADEDSLVRATDDREAVATLRRAFGDLPELQHAVLVQRELEGRSIPEIADRLGLTPTVVEGQLARGRRTLGQAYRELESGERCIAVRALCDASVAGRLGVRDRHRIGRHVGHCEGCRRHARACGVDPRLVDRELIGRASLLLPLPLLRRLPLDAGLAEHAGGLLGAKVLVGAAVVATAAGGSGVYVARVAPPAAPEPAPAVDAGGVRTSPFGVTTGPQGRTVVRVPGTAGSGPLDVVVPIPGLRTDARSTSPFLPPWLSAAPAASPTAPAAPVVVTPGVPVLAAPGAPASPVAAAPGATAPGRGASPSDGAPTGAGPTATADPASSGSAPAAASPSSPAGSTTVAPATSSSSSAPSAPATGDAPAPGSAAPATSDAPSPSSGSGAGASTGSGSGSGSSSSGSGAGSGSSSAPSAATGPTTAAPAGGGSSAGGSSAGGGSPSIPSAVIDLVRPLLTPRPVEPAAAPAVTPARAPDGGAVGGD